MAGSVVDIESCFKGYSDNIGRCIGELYSNWSNQRQQKVAEWLELRNYLFATDTSTTANGNLPWKNSTTTPKLCQIRDNLHSNYISALFPNDRWFRWEGYNVSDETQMKASAITAYMSNKIIESRFRDIASQLVYDYIDYGIAIAMPGYENNTYRNDNGEYLTGYAGPIASRISPLDIVFNPLATSFEKAPKIIRKILTLGEIGILAKQDEDWAVAFEKTKNFRTLCGGFETADFNKAVALNVDGFGSLQEYYGSSYVEVLSFYGDYYDLETNSVFENSEIIIIDRSVTVKNQKISSWIGKANINCAVWRKRPDNLYGMGPLENLVGLQYRIDHLENLKADAQDFSVHPMKKIKGDVDPFEWEPGGEIYIPGDGEVEEMGANLAGVITAQNSIDMYLALMEEMAGAPKQAMGIRTPGEKTAFEIQSLDNAAGRIFQEKVINFETNLLEPLLNAMLAEARQHLDGTDVVRTMDDDLGVVSFLEVTKEDITARGNIRPIGARHFAQQAQFLQNLNGIINGPIGSAISPHISGLQLAKVVEDALQLGRYGVVRPNVAVIEQAETQRLASAAQEQVMAEASVPSPGVL